MNSLEDLYKQLYDSVEKSDTELIQLYNNKIDEYITKTAITNEQKRWIVEQDEKIYKIMEKKTDEIKEIIIYQNKQQKAARMYEEG